MRLLKNYLDIEKEKIPIADTSVRIRKRVVSSNKDKTINIDIVDDTEQETLNRIKETYERLGCKSRIHKVKNPDFVIDRIRDECLKRGRSTKALKVEKCFDRGGFVATLVYVSPNKVDYVVKRSAMRCNVALLLLLEAVII